MHYAANAFKAQHKLVEGQPWLYPVPKQLVCGRWRLRPHKSMVVGVTGHKRRWAAVVPIITAAPSDP